MVVLSLPQDRAVAAALDALRQGLETGAVVFDTSTLDPLAARGFTDRSARRCVDCLDAPVSGGPAGVAEGACVLAVSRDAGLPERGYWVPLTILTGMTNAARLAQEGVFGPIVAAIPFDDEAEAIVLANATPYGLAGAVWTRDLGRVHRVAGAVRAGTFWINGYRTIPVSVPFGDFGASGFGRSSGIEALAAYTQPKAVWVDTAATLTLGLGHRPEAGESPEG